MKALLLAIPLLLAAPWVQAADLKTTIEGANKRWIEAFNRGDAAALAALYTGTATVLPPGADMAVGHDALLAFWKGAIDSGMKVTSLTTLSIERHGAVAREIGRVAAEAPGPDKKMTPIEGKYVVVWKDVKGVWKLDTDIWNLNK
jgi:ketosteroid isomerase-like protein